MPIVPFLVALALSEAPPILAVSPSSVRATQPQAVAVGKEMVVAYGSGDNLFVTKGDGVGAFGAPVLLKSEGRLSLGMRRGPRIAATKDSLVVSAIYGKLGGGKDGELVSWTSRDRGATWTGPVPVSDVPGAAREGLHAMAAANNGLVVCVWLDMRGRDTELWASSSRDGGKTWSKNFRIYRAPEGSICECCHPSVVFDSNGVLSVMFRNSIRGARDMYLIQSRDGGKSFSEAKKLGDGSWKLDACPMDGGALGVDRAGNVLTVWRRADTLYSCEPGKPERALGDGMNPWISATQPSLIAWQSGGKVWTLERSNVRELGAGKDAIVVRSGNRDHVMWVDSQNRIWSQRF